MDSDEEDEESNDVVDGVRAAWLLVERILAEDKGKYLVKWKKLPYDEAALKSSKLADETKGEFGTGVTVEKVGRAILGRGTVACCNYTVVSVAA